MVWLRSNARCELMFPGFKKLLDPLVMEYSAGLFITCSRASTVSEKLWGFWAAFGSGATQSWAGPYLVKCWMVWFLYHCLAKLPDGDHVMSVLA